MKGKHLLVTGGSGFLGKALLKRIASTNKVTVVARNEGNLLATKQEFPSIHIIAGDIADPCVCAQAMKGVDGVFHLAGFKHVTMAEDNTTGCVKTNVGGTESLLWETHLKKPEFVIATSTDKAAQVAGVYGASKLLMERLFKQYETLNPLTKYRIVRYGNVLYSTGSVLCRWKDALQSGKPITISEPAATRFYWTVDSAVDLLFDCLEKAKDASPYVPEMKAMKLGDILLAMQAKYGKATEISISGLRAGENLHERILENGPTSADVDRYSVEEIVEMV